MKSIIIVFLLCSCVSAQIHQEQLAAQRAQISQLEQNKKQQDNNINRYRSIIKKLMFRIAQKEEAKPALQPIMVKKTVCVDDDEDEVCIDFMVEEQ